MEISSCGILYKCNAAQYILEKNYICAVHIRSGLFLCAINGIRDMLNICNLQFGLEAAPSDMP